MPPTTLKALPPQVSSSRTQSSTSKKRKALEEENVPGAHNEGGEAEGERKRTKAGDGDRRAWPGASGGLPADFFDGQQGDTGRGDSALGPPTGLVEGKASTHGMASSTSAALPAGFFDASSDNSTITHSNPAGTTKTPIPASDPVDEDEWAAFERDIAVAANAAALAAPATISAPAVSAAELAARANADESSERTSKEAREAELEAEREDAARRLEEEFDEMESLEERVRLLREKREELRRRRDDAAVAGESKMDVEGQMGASHQEDRDDQGSGSDDDEGEGEWDDWRFRAVR